MKGRWLIEGCCEGKVVDKGRWLIEGGCEGRWLIRVRR